MSLDNKNSKQDLHCHTLTFDITCFPRNERSEQIVTSKVTLVSAGSMYSQIGRRLIIYGTRGITNSRRLCKTEAGNRECRTSLETADYRDPGRAVTVFGYGTIDNSGSWAAANVPAAAAGRREPVNTGHNETIQSYMTHRINVR